MLKKVLAKWKQYRYRFVPWIALNLKNRSVRSVPEHGDDNIITDEHVEHKLLQLFSALWSSSSGHPEDDTKTGCNTYEATRNSKILKDCNKSVQINISRTHFTSDCYHEIKETTTDGRLVYLPSSNKSKQIPLSYSLHTYQQTCNWLNLLSMPRRYGNRRKYFTHKVRKNDNNCIDKDNYSTENKSVFMSNMIKQQYGCSDTQQRNLDIMERCLGYSIQRAPSTVPGGGTGVKVSKGTIPKGSVVAMYPGCIYQPYEPVLFQSLGNPFIFRCIDSVLLDGNDKGVSRFLYRSCAQRDRIGPYFSCDMSWLTAHPTNPLAVGQYVNNQNRENPANVCYQEFDVPADFPLHLRQYIPNVHFSSSRQQSGSFTRLTRTVVLVSVRDIKEGEELFSTYFTIVH